MISHEVTNTDVLLPAVDKDYNRKGYSDFGISETSQQKNYKLHVIDGLMVLLYR